MNEISPVYEIQQYLRLLSLYGYDIPMIIPDGIYGAETRQAISAFQFLAGLPVSGIVDYETWQALYAAYESVQNITTRSVPIYPFEEFLSDGKITVGNTLPLVYIIQIILRTIGVAYKNFENQEITGVYDVQTENNILDFQRINGIPTTGQVDRITWDRLADAYNKYLNRN